MKLFENDQILILVRHGETPSNVAVRSKKYDQSSYYPVSGRDDLVPLTEQGKQQAFYAGRRLRRFLDASIPVDEIRVTTLRRTQDTARHLCSELGSRPPIVVEPLLDKRCNGLFWNMTYLGVELIHPDEFAKYLEEGQFHYRAPEGGENFPDCIARVKQLFDTTIKPVTTPFIRIEVLHLTSMIAYHRVLLGLSDKQVLRMYNKEHFGNGHISIFRRSLKSPNRRFKLIDCPE